MSSINSALNIATNAIDNIGSQISLVSHNIANVNTPDYADETLSQRSLTTITGGDGAVNGLIQRAVSQQAQADLFAQNGSVSALQTQQTALQQVDAVEGAVGSGTDLGSLLGQLTNSYSSLATNPSDGAQQQQVVDAAQALTDRINQISNTVQAQRQAAQDAIVTGVDTLNGLVTTLGALSTQIIEQQAAGQSTADLQNQRDAVEDKLSQLVSVQFLPQPNGDLLAVTADGLNLPLHSTSATPFATSAATLGAGVYAPGGGVPEITLGGQDVTSQLVGGTLGGNITLRDTTLPTIQANLDEFAQTLSSRFAAQGLTLFTNAGGTVPTSTGTPVQSGYLGYAQTIQVNPAVLADPALVRDGNTTITAGAGGATAFTPNPSGGPAGFETLITRIVQNALGTEVSTGVTQPAPNVTGLGASGTLSAGFAAPSDLAGQAAAVTAQEAQTSADTTASLTSAQNTQTILQSNLANTTAVSIDGEMSKLIVLQNAYGANARVVSTVESLFSALLQAIPG